MKVRSKRGVVLITIALTIAALVVFSLTDSFGVTQLVGAGDINNPGLATEERLKPGVPHVFQVDTRNFTDTNTILGLSARWNQHICQQKGWKYTLIDTRATCQSTDKSELCGASKSWSPVWTKVLGMLLVAHRQDQGLNVFLDSDALLSPQSEVQPHNKSLYMTIDHHSWWTGQCKKANYTVCLNTGVLQFHSTEGVQHLFRSWWARRRLEHLTPYERVRTTNARKPYNTKKSWCWEQDHLSDMMTSGSTTNATIGYMIDKGGGSIDNAPLTHIIHFHSGNTMERMLLHIGMHAYPFLFRQQNGKNVVAYLPRVVQSNVLVL